MDKATKAANKKKRKDDALELALLLYDIYQEHKGNGKIIIGQNNAQTNQK
jgi:hypothetical protein